MPRAVNPKTDAENAIVSGSLSYYGWTMTRTAPALAFRFDEKFSAALPVLALSGCAVISDLGLKCEPKRKFCKPQPSVDLDATQCIEARSRYLSENRRRRSRAKGWKDELFRAAEIFAHRADEGMIECREVLAAPIEV